MKTQQVSIRWLMRRDIPAVLGIEAHSFEVPWREADFARCLRHPACIGRVAEHDDRIVGFMVYEFDKTRLHLLNFAVDRIFRRLGVGTQMVVKLIGKLSEKRRNRIELEVRESNLPALMFFRANGFRAEKVLPEFYEQTADDAFLMRRDYRAKHTEKRPD